MSKKALINRILKIAIAVMVTAAFLFVSITIIKGVRDTFKETERGVSSATSSTDSASEE